MRISSLSKEYARVEVSAREGGAVVDLSNMAVEMAFTAPGVEPVSGDWKSAGWETVPPSRYIARCLIGPGGTVTLTDGTYDVWVRITDSPEVVVLPSGQLVIY